MLQRWMALVNQWLSCLYVGYLVRNRVQVFMHFLKREVGGGGRWWHASGLSDVNQVNAAQTKMSQMD